MSLFTDFVQRPQIHALVSVHFQKKHRGATNICQANHVGGFNFEMLHPQMLPGMEKGDQRIAIRIPTGEIRPLE